MELPGGVSEHCLQTPRTDGQAADGGEMGGKRLSNKAPTARG